MFAGYSRRRVLVVAFSASAAIVLACHEADVPTAPVVPPAPVITPPPVPPTRPVAVIQGPAPDGPGRSYVERASLYDNAFHGGAISSRYVLYEDSTLALEFLSGRFGYFTYLGRYRRTGDSLSLAFNGWSIVGSWEAVASLRADSLDVRYNMVMWLSDFVDGVYVRDPGRAASAIPRKSSSAPD